MLKQAYENGEPYPDAELLDRCYEQSIELLEQDERKADTADKQARQEAMSLFPDESVVIPSDAVVARSAGQIWVEAWIPIVKGH